MLVHQFLNSSELSTLECRWCVEPLESVGIGIICILEYISLSEIN